MPGPQDAQRRVAIIVTDFKCKVADVKNGIPIDFGAVKCVSVEYDQPCYDNISWYIQFDSFVLQLFH